MSPAPQDSKGAGYSPAWPPGAGDMCGFLRPTAAGWASQDPEALASRGLECVEWEQVAVGGSGEVELFSGRVVVTWAA